MEKMIVGVIGGALIVYGLIEKGKKIKDPNNEFVELPNPSAQTNGNISLVLGIVFVIGGLIA